MPNWSHGRVTWFAGSSEKAQSTGAQSPSRTATCREPASFRVLSAFLGSWQDRLTARSRDFVAGAARLDAYLTGRGAGATIGAGPADS